MIRSNSCRFCLKICKNTLPAPSTDQISEYFILTGFTVNINQDIPKKVCTSCSRTLKSFKKFRENAVTVEQKLIERKLSKDVEPDALESDASALSSIKAEQIVLKDDPMDVEPITLVKVEQTTKEEPAHPPVRKSSRPQKKPKKLYEHEPEDTVIVSPSAVPPAKTKSRVSKTRAVYCSLCHKVVNGLSELGIHINSVHSDQFYFTCHNCGDESECFQKRSDLIRHVKTHRAKLFPCRDCGMVFNNKTNLYSHKIGVHTVSERVCPRCGKVFLNSIRLRKHTANFHPKKEPICDKCGAKFNSMNQMTNHRMIHDPKKLSCEHCGKTFAQTSYLKQHMKTHDTTVYVCPLCPSKPFSFSTTLRLHLKAAHPLLNLPPVGTFLKFYDWTEDLKMYEEKMSTINTDENSSSNLLSHAK